MVVPEVPAVAKVPGGGLAEDDPVDGFLQDRGLPEFERHGTHVHRHEKVLG